MADAKVVAFPLSTSKTKLPSSKDEGSEATSSSDLELEMMTLGLR